MRSPCHECGIHQSGRDKNGPECMGCKARVEYVRCLGPVNYSVTDEESDMAGKLFTENEDIEILRTMREPAPAVAKKLGRALGSIYTRRSVLKTQLKSDPATTLTVGVDGSKTIDMGEYGDVYDMLCKRATAEMRTVNAQAIWILKCALQGGAADHGRARDDAP